VVFLSEKNGQASSDEQVFHRFGSCQVRVQLPHGSTQGGIARQGLLDLAAGVHDGAVVSAAEIPTDLVERQRGKPPREVHADLPGQQCVPAAAARLQLIRLNLEVRTDARGDALDARPSVVCLGAKESGDAGDIGHALVQLDHGLDRKSTRLNSSHRL